MQSEDARCGTPVTSMGWIGGWWWIFNSPSDLLPRVLGVPTNSKGGRKRGRTKIVFVAGSGSQLCVRNRRLSQGAQTGVPRFHFRQLTCGISGHRNGIPNHQRKCWSNFFPWGRSSLCSWTPFRLEPKRETRDAFRQPAELSDPMTGTTSQVSKYITPSQMVVVSTKACMTSTSSIST